MTNLFLPLVSFPYERVPVASAYMEPSFGFLASNKSATLGSPPVISLVFVPSTGTLAMNSPVETLFPLFFMRIDFEGSE